MRVFIGRIMRATKKYTTLDFALLKIGLIAIGILLGVYFSGFLGKYIAIVWVAAIISYIWIMFVTFIAYRR